MEIYGYIYRITNDVNDKFYIGQTIHDIKFRFDRHIKDSTTNKNPLNTHFARAIRKYGAEHFHIEKIDEAYSQEELTQKEYEWIKKTDATHKGYNESYAEYKCGGNTYASKTNTEMNDIKNKISKANSGKNNGNARAIKMKNIESGEELFFESVSEAQDYFNEPHHTTFTRRCKGTNLSLYKDKWKISFTENDYDDFKNVHINKQSVHVGPRKITVEDLYTHEISNYTSYREFERKNNIKYKSVAVKTTYIKGDTFIFKDRYKITLLN